MGTWVLIAAIAIVALGIALLIGGIVVITRRRGGSRTFLALGILGIVLGAALMGLGMLLIAPVLVNT